jgi:dienelactone hydrolase
MGKRMSKRVVGVLGGIAVAALVAAGCAVVPSYTSSNNTFEGFPVISYVPANPTGIVFVFHGTGGGAEFATKLETVDMLNHLTAAGYGFVSTESTNRTTKQWDTSSLSLTTNADLARLSRLYASLETSHAITASTPIYAIGMSRGAGFASVFAQAFENAGYPVAAIAPSHGQIPVSVRASGGLTVPAFFALGANDPMVDNAQVVAQVHDLQTNGVPASVTIEPEAALQATRLMRVPGIDGATANTIFDTFVDAGLWDRAGHRLVSIDTVESTLPALTYPSNVTAGQKQQLRSEVDVVLAVHEYSATYASQTVAFFDAHRAA